MINRRTANNRLLVGQNPNPRQPRSSNRMIDNCAIVPISACVFALIVSPLLLLFTPLQSVMESRPETRIFWPALAAISVGLVVLNRSRLTLPPHIICLLVYLAFAGSSVVWAFNP